MDNLYRQALAVARHAAEEAGKLIRNKIHRHRVTETKSCLSDLVTEVDRQSEDIIVKMIKHHFPGHVIVGEETWKPGRKQKPGDMTWYIDPLDGTTNFVFGISLCAVSIALARDGRPLLGVVHDPFKEETFSAARGTGTWLNGTPAGVDRDTATLDRSLLVTGYPGNINMRPHMHRVNLRQVIDRSNNLRALGSAALELAYVACGRFTGFWEVALRPWDVAAGMVLVEEAGGKVTNLAGQPLSLTEHVNIVATNGLIHGELIQCLDWRDDHDR